MRLLKFRMPEDFNLFLFGDLHIGSILFSRKKWEAFVNQFQSSYAGLPADRNYAVCHGDVIEAIRVDDPRYDPRVHKNFPLEQVQDAAELLSQLGDGLLVVLQGNHELALWRSGDWGMEIVNRLKEKHRLRRVEYGTLTAKISYLRHRGRRLLFKHYATHGRRLIRSYADDPERRESNEKLILKRHLKNMAGDALLMSKGHTHKLIVAEPKKRLYLIDDGERIVHRYTEARQGDFIPEDMRWYVNTGTFQKAFVLGVSTYAERMEMEPVILGYAVARVREGKIIGVDKVYLE